VKEAREVRVARAGGRGASSSTSGPVSTRPVVRLLFPMGRRMMVVAVGGQSRRCGCGTSRLVVREEGRKPGQLRPRSRRKMPRGWFFLDIAFFLGPPRYDLSHSLRTFRYLKC
jgi:hypothetical protein